MNSPNQDPVVELQKLVDSTVCEIESGGLSIEIANKVIEETRVTAEKLIPDDMEKYDMIYGARFKRLIEQYIPAAQE